jgi:hypothetical protein
MAEIKKPGTEVVDYKAELAALAVATAEAEKPSGTWMSFKNGQLTVNDTVIKGNKVQVVPLYSLFENQLYVGKWNPNDIKPPVCYAFGETEEDMAPHKDVENPQHPTCKGCPKNEWKSDPDGGNGKACKNVRRIAFLHRDDLETPEKVAKAPVAMAKISVTNVKNWSTYANQVSAVLKKPPIQTICELSVEPDAKTQFKINFALMDVIADDNPVLGALLKRRRELVPLMYAPYAKSTESAAPAENKKY